MTGAARIAQQMTDLQRREVAGAVADILRLCEKLGSEGIAAGPEDRDDPALILCDITTSLDLDDWSLIPEIVQHIIKCGAP
jgi:hypothetical protein